nr:hypothetical protein [Tanacetum cinerariifolium]
PRNTQRRSRIIVIQTPKTTRNSRRGVASTSSPRVLAMDVLNQMGCDGEIDDMLRIRFLSKLARKCMVLTKDVVRSLSAIIYCRDLDATTLRDFINSDGKLILEDPQLGVLRVGISKPPRASI